MSEHNELVDDLISVMNKSSTSSKAYLQGDHAQHTWGVEIPWLPFQWLIGGSNVLPAQRYFGVSGEPKTFKSTMITEIGNWFIASGGIHVLIDNENKTSPTMLDAMTWHNETIASRNSRIFKVTTSVSEWQTQMTKVIEFNRSKGEQEKGSRIPVFVSVDSLAARGTESADRDLRKEGAAAERGYPIGSLQITNYFETLNLLGTTASIGFVQHSKRAMEQSGGYGGPDLKEKGAQSAAFSSSTHIRIAKGKSLHVAKHDSAVDPSIPVEGYTLYLKTIRACTGPADNRVLPVDLLWQYIKDEEGRKRQAMWFDWHGALGRMLIYMKYSDKWRPKLFKSEKDELNDIIHFTEPNTNRVNCKRLDLKEVSYTEFGRAIYDNMDVYDELMKFLGISEYPDIQAADIDFSAGDLPSKR